MHRTGDVALWGTSLFSPVHPIAFGDDRCCTRMTLTEDACGGAVDVVITYSDVVTQTCAGDDSDPEGNAKWVGKLTPAELKGRLDEAQRLAAQLEEMYNLTK